MGSGSGARAVSALTGDRREATWCVECGTKVRLSDSTLLHFSDCRYYLYDLQYAFPFRLVRT